MKVSQKSHKSLTIVSQKSLKSLSKVSQKSLKSLSKVSQRSLKSLPQLCSALETLKSKVWLNDWLTDNVTYWAVLDSYKSYFRNQWHMHLPQVGGQNWWIATVDRKPFGSYFVNFGHFDPIFDTLPDFLVKNACLDFF